jgi:ATP-dependent Clp endopeptidase proteolytic subunit ClpP
MRPFPKAERWFDIRNVASASVDIYIFDVIGDTWDGEGVRAKELTAEIRALKGRDITVHINSPGGSVYDGFAIYNALRAHDANVTTMVEGAAFSAASTIAMAGKRIKMSKVSNMMIHDPSSMVWGNAAQMRKEAEALEVIKEAILNGYSRAKKTREELSQAMANETWLSPEQAVEWGLADEIVEGTVPTNYLRSDVVNLLPFKSLPEAAKNTVSLTPRSIHERIQRLNELTQPNK